MSFPLLVEAFTNNLLPILVLSSAGFAVGKTLDVDPRSIGRVIFYLFSPILAFDLLLNSELDWNEAFSTILFTVTIISSLAIAGFLASKLFKLERPHMLAVTMVSGFGNNGNYGLPLALFAFGDKALQYATVYFVTTSLLFNTLGVFIASLGQANLKTALSGMFKVPTVYAVIIAVILNWAGLHLPLSLKRTVDLAAGGTIPLMLVLLGVELSRANWSHNIRALGLGTFMRLCAGPAFGTLLASALGLQGAAFQAAVMQASMPAAVTNAVIATEYKLEPSLVTAIVLVTTLLSPFTLTPLIVLLTH